MTRRILRSVLASVAISLVPLVVHAQGSFDITGTIVGVTGQIIHFETSEITGVSDVFHIDGSNIRLSNLRVGDSATFTVAKKGDGMLGAWVVVDQGSRTMSADYGARSEFETTNETAEVQNRPDDDEARAKQKHEKGKED